MRAGGQENSIRRAEGRGRFAGLPVAVLLLAVCGLAGSQDPAWCSPGGSPESVHLWIGGDLQPGSGRHDILAPLVPLLNGLPGIVNLEGPVGDGSQPPAGRDAESPSLVNHPESLGRLHRAHIRVAGIANNHRFDLGDAGVRATIDALLAAEILPAGDPAGAAVLETPELGVVISAHDLGDGVPDSLAATLARDRTLGEVLVVLFHVKGPASYIPKPELKEAVEIALGAGAAVIAASGTHAVGPVERRGSAVIAWGLGNVAFECDCTREKDALLLLVSLNREGCAEAEVIPIEAGLEGAPAKPAADAEGVFDLLEAIGSGAFRRLEGRAVF